MLIVGEVRGQEAYVLFQALATGHGGMCTMHAENLDSAVKRLTQKPMEISPAYIPLMNVVISVQRVHLVKNGVKKAYRRILSTSEIVGYENYVNIFKWDPNADQQVSFMKKARCYDSIAKTVGQTTEDLVEEMQTAQRGSALDAATENQKLQRSSVE